MKAFPAELRKKPHQISTGQTQQISHPLCVQLLNILPALNIMPAAANKTVVLS